MNKRNDTRREVLLDVRDEPIMSIDALVEQCHRALSAQLWMTCCWSESGSGWKIGDYNYLVVSVEPDEDTSLYVQFWSEPRERVCGGNRFGRIVSWCDSIHRFGATERTRRARLRARRARRELREGARHRLGGGGRSRRARGAADLLRGVRVPRAVAHSISSGTGASVPTTARSTRA